jgi:O-antigen/teichoic acid export membrane protein
MPRPASREIARDFIYLSTTRSISLAISLVRSLIIPRFLGPTSYGLWKTLGLVQSYTQFADLGALAALKRQIPFHAQREDQRSLAEARDVAFFVNHVAIFTAAAGVLVVSFFVPDPSWARAMRLFIPLLYANHVHSFMEQFLFWRKDFVYASRINLALAVVEGVLAILGTIEYGLDGLIIGTFIGYALAAATQLRWIRFDIGFRFSWSTYRDLVKIGFPSHVNGLLYNLFMSVDRMLILPVLGLSGVGLYGLGMTVNEYLFQFSYALGNVIAPRLVERWSESESMEAMRPIVERPTLAISMATPMILGTVYFASAAAVEVILTNFRPALLPLQVLLAGTYFSSLHRGLSSFFLAIRKQARLLPVYAGAIALNTLLVSLALAFGWGITGVAAATSTALALFSLTLICMARTFFVKGVVPHLVFLARLLAPLAWGLVCVAAGEIAARAAGGTARPILAGAAGLVTFGLLYSPALLVAWKIYGKGIRSALPGARVG